MYSVHEITVAPCLYNNFFCCWDDRHLTLQASNYIEIILMIGRIMGCEFPSTNPVFLSSKVFHHEKKGDDIKKKKIKII
jgi:hypothetical protein